MSHPLSNIIIIFAVVFLFSQEAVSGQIEDGFVAYKTGDIDLAQKQWLALAIRGDVRAQFFLSVCFEKQSDHHKNRDNAKRWLTASANNGFVPAQFNLGNNFLNGKYGVTDIDMTEYWWDKAAVQGFPEAQYHLAKLYYRGKRGAKPNLKEAFYWFEQAAKGGHKKAVDAALLMRGGEAISFEKADNPTNVTYDDQRIISKLSFTLEQIALIEDRNRQKLTASKKTTEAPESGDVAQKEEPNKKEAVSEIKLPEEAESVSKPPALEQQDDWISQQPSKNYTIQILASTSIHECESYSRKLLASYKLTTHTQSFKKKGKSYCAVIQGSYGSYSQAKSNLSQLPRKIRKANPWIRKIARE
jgi:hypothetical protein